MSDSLQIEVVRARVLILNEYFPKYADYLDKVILYTKSDPASAFMKIRQVFEELLHDVWGKYINEDPPSMYEMINHISKGEGFSKRVLNRMNSLRTLCNLAVHGGEVNSRDVIMGISHLSEILEWYGMEYEGIRNIPEAVEPPLPFKIYMEESLQSSLFMLIILGHIMVPTALFRYHDLLSSKLNRPFLRIYEGIFDNLSFVVIYSALLVLASSLLSWSLFKRFRKQDFQTRIISFELMFMLVFCLQYFFLNVTDYYTGLY